MEAESFDDHNPDDLFSAFATWKLSVPKETQNKRRLSVRELKILRSENGANFPKDTRRAHIINLWRSAYMRVLSSNDPWEKFKFDQLPVELAQRYRYNAIKKKWVEDTVKIRIEEKSFSQGAMRECFRAKKLSNFSLNNDWSHASNLVAKRYIEPVAADVYFDDVCLQMDAKLWGEEFSRQSAIARKVDIAQMCVIKMINRPDQPLYHLEHFIEGTYRKYNSNSGFVDDVARNTPQAFSHFTFEQSGHRLIVVDIQGVGDLWTDPQIHTYDGKSYGDGNLGIRGMALFFHTHRCNPLCQALELDPFDLCPGEQQASALVHHITPLVASPSPNEKADRSKCGERDVGCQLSTGVESNEGSMGSLDSFNFGATMAIPRSQRVSYQRLHSETVGESGFVDPSDFLEPHSLPSQGIAAYLPACSPIVHRGEVMSHSPGKWEIVHKQRQRTSSHASSKDRLINDFPDVFSCESDVIEVGFNPLTSAEMTYDSGVHFDQSTPSVVIGRQLHARRRAYTGESWPEGTREVDIGWRQSNYRLNGSRSGLNGSHSGLESKFPASSESSLISKTETEMLKVFEAHRAGHRSSCVSALRNSDASILGRIHHELARLHAIGRFAPVAGGQVQQPNPANERRSALASDAGLDALAALHEPENINWDAVIFHEEQAATLQCFDAVESLAQYYLGLPINGPLAHCPLSPDPTEAPIRGLTLASTAASLGDRRAMLYLAEINYTGRGNNLTDPESITPDWCAAAHWYHEAAKTMDLPDRLVTEEPDQPAGIRSADFDSMTVDWPVYRLHGRLAEMYATGGHGLEQDRSKAYELFESAADGASEAMQGKLAMKYYEQAALLEDCVDGEGAQ